jgi:hypothetical protein
MAPAARTLPVAIGIVAIIGVGVFWRCAYAVSGEIDAPLTMSDLLVCDTPDEVQTFVNGDLGEEIGLALHRVNDRYGASACSAGTVLFKVAGQIGTVAIPDGVVRIAKIEVYGKVVDGALQPLMAPQTQYAPVFEKATRV